MLTFVIVFNLSLTLLNFYLAYRLWGCRQALIQARQWIDQIEEYCDRILPVTPALLLQRQNQLQAIRQSYPHLYRPLLQLRSVIGIIRQGSKLRLRRLKSP